MKTLFRMCAISALASAPLMVDCSSEPRESSAQVDTAASAAGSCESAGDRLTSCLTPGGTWPGGDPCMCACDTRRWIESGCVTGPGDDTQTDFIYYNSCGGECYPRDPDPAHNGSPDNGTPRCNESVGAPINVTTGNMTIREVDFESPRPLGTSLVRTYNSQMKAAGAFGYGWSSALDESLELNEDNQNEIWVTLADGQAVRFALPQRVSWYLPYTPVAPAEFPGTAQTNMDGTYSLNYRDGSVHSFAATFPTGKTTISLWPHTRITSIVDPQGNRTSFAYEIAQKATGAYVIRVKTVTDPFGNVLTFGYPDATASNPTTVRDAAGVIATFGYTYGRLDSVTYADGSKHSYAYDAGLRITSVVDALGNLVEAHTYDGQGRALTSTLGGGIEQLTLEYASPTETDVTDALGNTKRFEFTTAGGRNRVTAIDGGCNCTNAESTEWTYDANGNVTSVSDALKNTTNYAYDARNQLTSVTDPAGGVTRYTYNDRGEVLRATDPLGGVTQSVFDASGNLIQQIDPAGSSTQLTRDAHGLVTKAVDPLGHATTLSRDASGNVVAMTDPFGNKTVYSYDAHGRPNRVTGPAGDTAAMAYDLVGRLDRVVAGGGATTMVYDLAGRRTGVTDPLNHVTSQAYDAAGRLLSRTDPAGHAVSFTRDAMSNLTQMTDEDLHVTKFARDPYGRVTSTVFPNGRAETYAYDAAGRVASKVDRKGVKTTYGYDPAGRLTSKEYSDGSPAVTYAYDAAGRRTGAANAASRVTWTYDRAGRVVSEASSLQGSNLVYGYDAAGDRTSLAVNGALYSTFAYDAGGRLASITRSGRRFDFAYDAGSRRASLAFPNGVTTRYGYDTSSRLDALAASTASGVVTGPETLAYDVAGHLLSRVAESGTTSYAYDAATRLARVTTSGAIVEGYTYDAAGNRTSAIESAGWTYDANDALTSSPGESLVYDANGNLTSRTDASGHWTYEWDVENQLARVAKDGAEVARFAYDAIGRRVTKTTSAGASTTTYLYDGDEILRESRAGAGAGTRYYVHGPKLDEPLSSEDSAAGLSYFHADERGSIVKTTDAKGAVNLTRAYDSFGVPQAGGATSGYAFTGREWDAESGLYYYRARYYSPRLGRFISEDPTRFSKDQNLYRFVDKHPVAFIDARSGPNLYVYVGSNPVNASDPWGTIDTLPTPTVGQRISMWFLCSVLNFACPAGPGELVKFPHPQETPECVEPTTSPAAGGSPGGGPPEEWLPFVIPESTLISIPFILNWPLVQRMLNPPADPRGT